MDLIRAILSRVEQSTEEQLTHDWLTIEGYDQPTVARHAELMKEAGLVEAHILRGAGVAPQAARVFRLTWAGHEFLEAIRNDTTWAKTKNFLKENGGSFSIEVVKAVAIKMGLAHLGLPQP